MILKKGIPLFCVFFLRLIIAVATPNARYARLSLWALSLHPLLEWQSQKWQKINEFGHKLPKLAAQDIMLIFDLSVLTFLLCMLISFNFLVEFLSNRKSVQNNTQPQQVVGCAISVYLSQNMRILNHKLESIKVTSYQKWFYRQKILNLTNKKLHHK